MVQIIFNLSWKSISIVERMSICQSLAFLMSVIPACLIHVASLALSAHFSTCYSFPSLMAVCIYFLCHGTGPSVVGHKLRRLHFVVAGWDDVREHISLVFHFASISIFRWNELSWRLFSLIFTDICLYWYHCSLPGLPKTHSSIPSFLITCLGTIWSKFFHPRRRDALTSSLRDASLRSLVQELMINRHLACLDL